MPSHSHNLWASSEPPNTVYPDGAMLAFEGLYAHGDADVEMQSAVRNAGGQQGHNNMQPYLVITYCVALVGEYPTQD